MGTIKSSMGKLSAHTSQQVESKDVIEMVKEVCNNYKVLQAIKLPDVDVVTPDNVAEICNIAGAYTEALSKVIYSICNVATHREQEGKRLASSLFLLVKNYI